MIIYDYIFRKKKFIEISKDLWHESIASNIQVFIDFLKVNLHFFVCVCMITWKRYNISLNPTWTRKGLCWTFIMSGRFGKWKYLQLSYSGFLVRSYTRASYLREMVKMKISSGRLINPRMLPAAFSSCFTFLFTFKKLSLKLLHFSFFIQNSYLYQYLPNSNDYSPLYEFLWILVSAFLKYNLWKKTVCVVSWSCCLVLQWI